MSLRAMLLRRAKKTEPVIDDDDEDNFRRKVSSATKRKRSRRQIFSDSDSEDDSLTKKSKTTQNAACSKKTQPKKSETTPQRTVSTRSSPAKKDIHSSLSLKMPTSTVLRGSPRKTASPSASKKQKNMTKLSPSTSKKKKKTTLLDFFGNAPIKQTYRLEADCGSISGQNELICKHDNTKMKEDVMQELVPEAPHNIEVVMEFDEVAKTRVLLEEEQAIARKELIAHEDEEFVKTLKEEDSSHCHVDTGSQQPLKKPRLKLERVKMNSLSSSFTSEQDMLSPDMTTPSKDSCKQRPASKDTQAEPGGMTTPPKDGGRLRPASSKDAQAESGGMTTPSKDGGRLRPASSKETQPKNTQEASATTTPRPITVKHISSPRKQKRAHSVTPRMTESVSPQTRDEQKSKRRENYTKYLNRSGPQHPGSKDIPEGAENCLEGLTFVLTGVLDSLEREEVKEVIQRYGGRVTGSVSGRTSYVVAGEDAGSSKLGKARANSTPIIDENELLELIRSRPTPSKRWTKKGVGTHTSKKGASAKMTKSFSSRKWCSSDSVPHDSCPDSRLVQTESLSTSMSRTDEMEGCVVEKADIADRGKTEPGRLLWVDKYRPVSTKQLVGAKGGASNASKLSTWLLNWQGNHMGCVTKSGKTARGVEKSSHKAVLLAGPPGVGKTTTAQLVCKEAGYSYVEMNASSCRSKSALHQEVASQLGSLSLMPFMSHRRGGMACEERRALIMDEVDGMDGNADRGGISELISLIKSSCIPIICICNDRQSSKMRSLTNHCYLLTFSPPKVEQIRGALMSICFKENIKIEPQALTEIIMASGQDMRQVLHNLSLWSAADALDTPLKVGVVKRFGAPKLKMSPFDVVRKVFEPFEGGQELSLQEKSELFFHDYSMSSLFVQENYVKARPRLAEGNMVVKLKCLALAADSLCQGDVVERLIRRQSRWDLLPLQSFLSSVIPGEHMKGSSCARPMFPRWLGMYSKRNSNDQSLQDLQQHTRLIACCNKTEFGLDYLPILSSRLTTPLVAKGAEGIPDVVASMHHYGLSREDWDSMVALSHYSGRPEIASQISSKVKASFTRSFNKGHHCASAGKKRVTDTSNHNHDEGDASVQVKKKKSSKGKK